MNRIRTLYQSLTKSEIRALRSLLQSLNQSSDNKALQLLKLLERKKPLDNAAMSLQLYGDPRSKAFIMLKRRLTDRILDVMSNSASLSTNSRLHEDRTTMKVIVMYKMLVYAKMLKSRGLIELTRETLEKCLELAQESGHTEVQLLALAELRILSQNYEEMVQHFDPTIDEALEAYRTDLQGIRMSNEFSHINRKGNFLDPEVFADRMEVRITRLQERLDLHYSKRAHLYLLNMKFRLHQMRNEFEQCREVFDERAALFEENPGLVSKNRLGITYYHKAKLEGTAHQFSEAAKVAETAMQYFPARKRNHHLSAHLRIISLIYEGQLDEAADLIESLKAFMGLKQMEPIQSYYTYFEACIAYFREDYGKVARLFFNDPSMSQHKSGWNVWQRILEIMASVDEGEHRLATARIENLRKHLSRHQAGKREQLIFRFLYHLERNAFLFHPMSERMREDLQEMEREAPWAPFSEEVTRFESWVEAHECKRSFYAHLCEYFRKEESVSA